MTDYVNRLSPIPDQQVVNDTYAPTMFHMSIIVYGNYKPTIKNKEGKDEIIPYEKFKESHKKMISKNDEAKMVLYNVLPKKEYERIFMYNTAKDVWNSLIITHQGFGDLQRQKRKIYKSLALKAIKSSSDEEVSCSKSDDEEYAMAVRDFKIFFRRRGTFVCQPHNDKRNFQKIKEDKNDKEDRSDSEEDSKKEEICLMSLDNNEVRLKVRLKLDEWIKDNGCSRHIMGNKYLFSTYKAIDGGNVVFGSNIKTKIIRKETMMIEESLNVRFDESPPPKSSPLVDDDIIESQIIENQIEDIEIKKNEPLNKEIVNIKKSKDHPIDSVIEHAEVYYECMEPFKSLMCLWVRSRSIAATWLEKVVTP
nr:retrotransposon protein [Tanacetum cinerariifolium]